jgi:hypothetical protein
MKHFYLFALATLLLSSCLNNEIIEKEFTKENGITVKQKNGILVFNSFADVINLQLSQNNLTEIQIANWEKELQFTSQQTILKESFVEKQ